MTNVKEEVKAIIAEKLGIDVAEVADSANIQNDLGADSLDVVELIMDFEKKFGIEIPDEDAGNNITTVADAVKYVEQKLGL